MSTWCRCCSLKDQKSTIILSTVKMTCYYTKIKGGEAGNETWIRQQATAVNVYLLFLYLLLTLVLDSRYHRLNSIPPEISMAKPPWNSTAARTPDCRGITYETDRKRNELTWTPTEELIRVKFFMVFMIYYDRAVISSMTGTKSHVSFNCMRHMMELHYAHNEESVLKLSIQTEVLVKS